MSLVTQPPGIAFHPAAPAHPRGRGPVRARGRHRVPRRRGSYELTEGYLPLPPARRAARLPDPGRLPGAVRLADGTRRADGSVRRGGRARGRDARDRAGRGSLDGTTRSPARNEVGPRYGLEVVGPPLPVLGDGPSPARPAARVELRPRSHSAQRSRRTCVSEAPARHRAPAPADPAASGIGARDRGAAQRPARAAAAGAPRGASPPTATSPTTTSASWPRCSTSRAPTSTASSPSTPTSAAPPRSRTGSSCAGARPARRVAREAPARRGRATGGRVDRRRGGRGLLPGHCALGPVGHGRRHGSHAGLDPDRLDALTRGWRMTDRSGSRARRRRRRRARCRRGRRRASRPPRGHACAATARAACSGWSRWSRSRPTAGRVGYGNVTRGGGRAAARRRAARRRDRPRAIGLVDEHDVAGAPAPGVVRSGRASCDPTSPPTTSHGGCGGLRRALALSPEGGRRGGHGVRPARTRRRGLPRGHQVGDGARRPPPT